MSHRFVVSANFRNRANPCKWLFRMECDGVDTYRPASRIVAKDVMFERSGQIEKGYGCNIVAKAQDIQVSEMRYERESLDFKALGYRRLKFNGMYDFLDDESKEVVKCVKEMVLSPDGSMHYLPLDMTV